MNWLGPDGAGYVSPTDARKWEVKQRRAQGLELRRLDRQQAELLRAKKRVGKALG